MPPRSGCMVNVLRSGRLGGPRRVGRGGPLGLVRHDLLLQIGPSAPDHEAQVMLANVAVVVGRAVARDHQQVLAAPVPHRGRTRGRAPFQRSRGTTRRMVGPFEGDTSWTTQASAGIAALVGEPSG